MSVSLFAILLEVALDPHRISKGNPGNLHTPSAALHMDDAIALLCSAENGDQVPAPSRWLNVDDSVTPRKANGLVVGAAAAAAAALPPPPPTFADTAGGALALASMLLASASAAAAALDFAGDTVVLNDAIRSCIALPRG